MSFPNFALHATPVNRVAARVSFGESDAYTPKINGPCLTFDFPPIPLKPQPKEALDITGIRRGFMTAMRYHNSRKGKGSQWLCRCDCGKYEVRNVRSWMKVPDQPDACAVCVTTFSRTQGHTMHGVHNAKIFPQKTHSAIVEGGAA